VAFQDLQLLQRYVILSEVVKLVMLSQSDTYNISDTNHTSNSFEMMVGIVFENRHLTPV
jgi:hypothetical protein